MDRLRLDLHVRGTIRDARHSVAQHLRTAHKRRPAQVLTSRLGLQLPQPRQPRANWHVVHQTPVEGHARMRMDIDEARHDYLTAHGDFLVALSMLESVSRPDVDQIASLERHYAGIEDAQR